MGKRGPKAQPQSLLDLKGNPERRPRKPDPIKADGSPTMPLWLDVHGMSVFINIIKSMPPDFYTAADTHLLAMYAEACSLAVRAIEELQDRGITIDEETVSEKGGYKSTVKKNPAHSVLSDAMSKIATLGTRLGLDPTARQAIGGFAPPKEDQAANNGFGDLIGNGGGFSPTVVEGGKK